MAQLGNLVTHVEAARRLIDKPPHPEEPCKARRFEGPVLSEAEG
ncbi:hypothetical protein [Reyranella massiliensis]|nr:hypothetical protein [Reyranella massiliensis]